MVSGGGGCRVRIYAIGEQSEKCITAWMETDELQVAKCPTILLLYTMSHWTHCETQQTSERVTQELQFCKSTPVQLLWKSYYAKIKLVVLNSSLLNKVRRNLQTGMYCHRDWHLQSCQLLSEKCRSPWKYYGFLKKKSFLVIDCWLLVVFSVKLYKELIFTRFETPRRSMYTWLVLLPWAGVKLQTCAHFFPWLTRLIVFRSHSSSMRLFQIFWYVCHEWTMTES